MHSVTQRDPLTTREREVLWLIGRGLSNRLIARELVLSEKTAKRMSVRSSASLEAADRAQGALLAVRDGLVDP